MPTPGQRLRRRIFGHRGIIIGGGILGIIVLLALLAPLLAPYDPYAQDIAARIKPPVWYARGSWEHILGTDQLGRDYLSRLIYGARISLLIGFCRRCSSRLDRHRHGRAPPAISAAGSTW